MWYILRWETMYKDMSFCPKLVFCSFGRHLLRQSMSKRKLKVIKFFKNIWPTMDRTVTRYTYYRLAIMWPVAAILPWIQSSIPTSPEHILLITNTFDFRIRRKTEVPWIGAIHQACQTIRGFSEIWKTLYLAQCPSRRRSYGQRHQLKLPRFDGTESILVSSRYIFSFQKTLKYLYYKVFTMCMCVYVDVKVNSREWT